MNKETINIITDLVFEIKEKLTSKEYVDIIDLIAKINKKEQEKEESETTDYFEETWDKEKDTPKKFSNEFIEFLYIHTQYRYSHRRYRNEMTPEDAKNYIIEYIERFDLFDCRKNVDLSEVGGLSLKKLFRIRDELDEEIREDNLYIYIMDHYH
jgi:hypothetical protein